MKYRRLGKTNVEVSVVGVGTWQFGGEWGREYSQDEATSIIQTARDVGINLIDTAECYGDHSSERLVGAAIKNDRDYWFLATKFGHRFYKNYDRSSHFDPKSVLNQLDESLKALKTDFIDLYQFHSGSDAEFDQPQLWEALARQVQAGKIRHIGLSVSPNTNLHQIEQASQYGIEVVQIVYNRLDRAPETTVFPSIQEQDLGVLARVPLASGFLSGKYKPGSKFTNPNDVRSLRDEEHVEAQLREVEKIQQEEVPQGSDMAAWALAWCLRHPAVSAVIPGCKNPQQVIQNAQAVELLEE